MNCGTRFNGVVDGEHDDGGSDSEDGLLYPPLNLMPYGDDFSEEDDGSLVDFVVGSDDELHRVGDRDGLNNQVEMLHQQLAAMIERGPFQHDLDDSDFEGMDERDGVNDIRRPNFRNVFGDLPGDEDEQDPFDEDDDEMTDERVDWHGAQENQEDEDEGEGEEEDTPLRETLFRELRNRGARRQRIVSDSESDESQGEARGDLSSDSGDDEHVMERVEAIEEVWRTYGRGMRSPRGGSVASESLVEEEDSEMEIMPSPRRRRNVIVDDSEEDEDSVL
jgi:hypothetical protein